MQDYEIYNVDLPIGRGHEQSGERPAVVVRAMNELDLCTVVPLTSNMQRAELPYTVVISKTQLTNLKSDSVALVINVGTITAERIKGRMIGKLDSQQIEKIRTALKNLFKL